MALAQDTSGPAARVLLFSATRGYRHDSIPTAIRRLRDRGLANSRQHTSLQLLFPDFVLT
jgi:hypothetical protein